MQQNFLNTVCLKNHNYERSTQCYGIIYALLLGYLYFNHSIFREGTLFLIHHRLRPQPQQLLICSQVRALVPFLILFLFVVVTVHPYSNPYGPGPLAPQLSFPTNLSQHIGESF